MKFGVVYHKRTDVAHVGDLGRTDRCWPDYVHLEAYVCVYSGLCAQVTSICQQVVLCLRSIAVDPSVGVIDSSVLDSRSRWVVRRIINSFIVPIQGLVFASSLLLLPLEENLGVEVAFTSLRDHFGRVHFLFGDSVVVGVLTRMSFCSRV